MIAMLDRQVGLGLEGEGGIKDQLEMAQPAVEDAAPPPFEEPGHAPERLREGFAVRAVTGPGEELPSLGHGAKPLRTKRREEAGPAVRVALEAQPRRRPPVNVERQRD